VTGAADPRRQVEEDGVGASGRSATVIDGGSLPVGEPERRREAWRRILAGQLTRLRERAEGSDPAAQDAAARAARLAVLLEQDGALPAR
jgi:hypothetical protein